MWVSYFVNNTQMDHQAGHHPAHFNDKATLSLQNLSLACAQFLDPPSVAFLMTY